MRGHPDPNDRRSGPPTPINIERSPSHKTHTLGGRCSDAAIALALVLCFRSLAATANSHPPPPLSPPTLICPTSLVISPGSGSMSAQPPVRVRRRASAGTEPTTSTPARRTKILGYPCAGSSEQGQIDPSGKNRHPLPPGKRAAVSRSGYGNLPGPLAAAGHSALGPHEALSRLEA